VIYEVVIGSRVHWRSSAPLVVEFELQDLNLALRNQSIVQSFEQFIRENKNEITALQILYSRPYRQRLTQFLDALEATLADYRDCLAATPWNHELWRHFRGKMAATIKDCEP
jgi:hypothetical protein